MHIRLHRTQTQASTGVITNTHDDMTAETTAPVNKNAEARPEVPPSVPFESFPFFNTGDVAVHTRMGDIELYYRLHSEVLSRNSSYFQEEIEEASSSSEPLYFEFELDPSEQLPWLVWKPELAQQFDLEIEKENPQDTADEFDSRLRIDDAAGKDFMTLSPHSNQNDGPILERATDITVLRIHKEIFGMFYNFPPAISTTDINRALNHAELLVIMSARLGCVQVLRPFLNAHFSDFGQALYNAIARDPPGWFKLSVFLENTAIYKEAYTHLVGAWFSPWNWISTKYLIPTDILLSIEEKAKSLDAKCVIAQRDLMIMEITENDGKPIEVSSTGDSVETWIVMAIYRDWIAKELGACTHLARDESTGRLVTDFDMRKLGALFRKIGKGGDAYLKSEDVLAEVKKQGGFGEGKWEWLELDLKGLKEMGQHVVEELTKNETHVDVEALGVRHLTCCKVEDEDVPWLRERGEGV